MLVPLSSINTSSCNGGFTTSTASSTVCAPTYVMTLLNVLAKPGLPHKSFADLSDKPSRKMKGSTGSSSAGLSCDEVWAEFVLYGLLLHYWTLLFVIPTLQLIIPSCLPFTIQLISFLPGKTNLFCLAQPASPAQSAYHAFPAWPAQPTSPAQVDWSASPACSSWPASSHRLSQSYMLDCLALGLLLAWPGLGLLLA